MYCLEISENPVCDSTVPTGSQKSFYFNNFKTNTHTFMEMNVNLQCAVCQKARSGAAAQPLAINFH